MLDPNNSPTRTSTILEHLTADYSLTIYAIGTAALLLLLQLVVADAIAIKNKHTPGTKIEDNHENLLFRASRAMANMNESIGVFICAVLFCLLSSASPSATGAFAWIYIASRAIYAVFYYFNLQLFRSVSFGFSLTSLFALLLVGLVT